MSTGQTVFIIDDDAAFVATAQFDLEQRGYHVEHAGCIAAAQAAIAARHFDVVLLDGRLPDGDGLGLLPDLVRANALVKIIVISGFASVQHVQAALRTGAIAEYFTKPLDWPAVVHAVERGIRVSDLERTVAAARPRATRGEPPHEDIVQIAGRSRAPLLLVGPTGSGKTRLARRIHELGGESRPFVAVNCAAIPATLFEAELFGVERGAFTGAHETRYGLVELAERGTLLLDEIAEMPDAIQAKLLAVIEERTVRRVGSALTRPIDLRVIAATHRDVTPPSPFLRADLFYRLSVLRIELPPLQQRDAVFATLVPNVLSEVAEGRACALADGELERLRRHAWPGNIRELRNVLERSLLFDPPDSLQPSRFILPSASSEPATTLLAEVERQHILKVYGANQRNQRVTAEQLGISLSTLRRRLSEFGESV
jgi:DNA-binding NtrC family response regulator